MEHDRLEELLDDPVLRASDRAQLLGLRAELVFRRGDWEAGRGLVQESLEIAAGTDDPQTLLGIERGQAMVALFEGRGRDVFEIGRRHFLETPFAPLLATSIAAEGAALEGDPVLLEEVGGFVETLVADSPLKDGLRNLVAGLGLIVEGEEVEDGVALVNGAIDRFESVDMTWVAFEAMVFGARALPASHPARADLIARARIRAEETGAPGLVRWLEAMTV